MKIEKLSARGLITVIFIALAIANLLANFVRSL